MRKLRRLGAIVAGVALVLGCLPAFSAGGSVTVGQFVQELAKVKRLNAADARTAAESLGRVGVRIPAGTDLSKRLTEGDVAELSRLAGLNVTTTRPDTTFDGERLDLFFDSFANELTQTGDTTARGSEGHDDSGGNGTGTGLQFDPYSKGKGGSKGKKKGHRSPTDPE
jgi:hypothetical protein